MNGTPAFGPSQLPPVVGSPWQGVVVDAMLLFWILAAIIAVWGSVTESARAERERRRTLATDSDPGPTPGIDGFLDRWGVWSLCLAGLGLICLGLLSFVTHR